MDEIKAIDSAYLTAIQNLFKALTEAYISAKGNKAEEEKADAAFKLGLEFHRKVYNRAKTLTIS